MNNLDTRISLQNLCLKIKLIFEKAKNKALHVLILER